MDKNNQRIRELIKKNIYLGLLYPIVILINIYLLNEFKASNSLNVFILLSLTNQFDIGLLKNCFFNKEKYNIGALLKMFSLGLVITSFISIILIQLIQVKNSWDYLFIVPIGLLANEFKSFFDSGANYVLGFLVKNVMNLSVIFFFLVFDVASIFYPLLIFSVITLALFVQMYRNLGFEEKHRIIPSDFKFFALNIFSYISGNVDRFLVIPLIGYPLKSKYLYFSETNSKLNGLFGFLNNLFLYKHLKFSRELVLIVGFLLTLIITSLSFLFEMENIYFIFSLSLGVSILSQYYIYSKIGDLKTIYSSLFPLIGLFFYLISFYIFYNYFTYNLILLTITSIIKSISEMLFIRIVLKQSNRVYMNT